MKLRTTLDITVILLFITISVYYAYKYLAPKNKSANIVRLAESPTSITDEKIKNIISETSASDSNISWYPDKLSNRWENIEIFQSGLFSGNSQTLSKRLVKKNNPEDLGFHFIITNGYGGADGLVDATTFWKAQKDTLPLLDATQNVLNSKSKESLHHTISICLIGDFTARAPTAKQISSLKALLNYLLEETAVKSFNISFNSASTLQKIRNPKFLPLELLLKTRTSN